MAYARSPMGSPLSSSLPKRSLIFEHHDEYVSSAAKKQNLPQQHEPFIIGVAGGTASGKTTVCNQIMQNLHDQRVAMISMDSFYRGLSEDEKVGGRTPISPASLSAPRTQTLDRRSSGFVPRLDPWAKQRRWTTPVAGAVCPSATWGSHPTLSLTVLPHGLRRSAAGSPLALEPPLGARAPSVSHGWGECWLLRWACATAHEARMSVRADSLVDTPQSSPSSPRARPRHRRSAGSSPPAQRVAYAARDAHQPRRLERRDVRCEMCSWVRLGCHNHGRMASSGWNGAPCPAVSRAGCGGSGTHTPPLGSCGHNSPP